MTSVRARGLGAAYSTRRLEPPFAPKDCRRTGACVPKPSLIGRGWPAASGVSSPRANPRSTWRPGCRPRRSSLGGHCRDCNPAAIPAGRHPCDQGRCRHPEPVADRRSQDVRLRAETSGWPGRPDVVRRRAGGRLRRTPAYPPSLQRQKSAGRHGGCPGEDLGVLDTLRASRGGTSLGIRSQSRRDMRRTAHVAGGGRRRERAGAFGKRRSMATGRRRGRCRACDRGAACKKATQCGRGGRGP